MTGSGAFRSGPFLFDPALLLDLGADPSRRDREWRAVFEHFDPRLRGYFHARVRDGDELDELMSDVWRRALLHMHELRSFRAAWSWLLKIGINLLHDRRRSVERRAHITCLDAASDEVAGLVAPVLLGDSEDGDDRRGVLAERIAALNEADRRILVGHFVDELSYEQLAGMYGLPSAAAGRKRVQRLRERLLRPAGAELPHRPASEPRGSRP